MDDELRKTLISVVSYVLLFILIFGLAGTVEYTEFRKQFKEWRAICVGFFGQFVMLPFLGFLSVKAFGLTRLGASDAVAMGANATQTNTSIAFNATNGTHAHAAATIGAGGDAMESSAAVVGIEAVILMLTTSSPGGS